MRKTALLIATALLTATLTACSGSTGTTSDSTSKSNQQEAAATDTTTETQTEPQAAAQASTTESDGGINVDKGLLNVEITIPADYAETYGFTFKSQEEADSYAKEQGFKSVTLGDDSSVSLVMSKSQHKKMMDGLNKTIDEALQEMVGSEDYPNITAVEHNDNFTDIKVTTKSEELSLNESFSTLSLYLFGGMYNAFNGTPVDNIHIDFVNNASGEVIDSFDSKNLEDDSTSTDANEPTDDTDYSAQLEKEEYIYDDGYGSVHHFIAIKNNSDQTLSISTNSVAYNESGDKIGAGSGSLQALGPQSEQLVIEYIDNVSDVDHFETTISASKSQWYEDVTGDIDVEADIFDDKAILTCTNNGDKAAEFVEGRVIFLKDGECVGYDTHYFNDEEGKLKSGESLTKQFDYYDGTFDEAKYYIIGTVHK